MSLLTGEWSMVADGHDGVLHIEYIDPPGLLDTHLVIPGLGLGTGGDPFVDHEVGYWDEGSQTIILHYVSMAQPGTSPHLGNIFTFKGCQFSTPHEASPGQDIVWTLAGLFEMGHGRTIVDSSAVTVPNARRSCFGWYATKTQTI